MILSEKWLREWVETELDLTSLGHMLTMSGLEVESIDSLANGLSGVIVAEIVSVEPHPKADRLRICSVNTGVEILQVVCGAPNAKAGIKAPLAQPGATLPGGIRIKTSKLRGLESQGMLCSAAELQLSEDHEELLALPSEAPLGLSIQEYFDLDDHLIEIGLTPNRSDCLSLLGVARDLAVTTEAPLRSPEMSSADVTIDDVMPISVLNSKKCPRYLGRVIRDVDVSRPVPLFMAERLRRAGIRSIDPVVDITNYVMLELGQPLHAFDLDVLDTEIVVRDAQLEENIVLLDGESRELIEGTLVIADQSKPLALAGIMGGQGSGVSAKTRNLFLEAAFFTPELLAGRARQYGLHTDASHRFERGVDFELPMRAIERATVLMLEWVGGSAGPIVDVTSEESLPKREPVVLTRHAIKQILGIDIADTEIRRILRGLGFSLQTGIEREEWLCTAPPWRFDMGQEADLLEEIARVHGYDRIPAPPVQTAVRPIEIPEKKIRLRDIKTRLVARGFSEAITYSFVNPKIQHLFDPDLDPIILRNPISADLAVMRTSLVPGLLEAVAHNVKRQTERVRLFESGLRFTNGPEIKQEQRLALVMTGSREPEGWSNKPVNVDFYDLKGEVEALLYSLPNSIEYRQVIRPGFHDGQTADIYWSDKLIGVMGRVHPMIAKTMDIPDKTFAMELDLISTSKTLVPEFIDFSRYPEIRRDISVLVEESITAAEVISEVERAAGDGLSETVIFDVYLGEGISDNHKSLAIGLTFRDQSRTLTDEEIGLRVTQVVDSLSENLGAKLRG